MVDFNNETTVSTPPGDIVKIVVLERREQCIEAIESYYHSENNGTDLSPKINLLRARIMAFWYQVQAMVKRRIEDKKYEQISEEIAKAKDEEELLGAFEWLNEFVDELGLTYIDSRNKYDRTRVEDANKKKGL